jgi:hypothetical protein
MTDIDNKTWLSKEKEKELVQKPNVKRSINMYRAVHNAVGKGETKGEKREQNTMDEEFTNELYKNFDAQKFPIISTQDFKEKKEKLNDEYKTFYAKESDQTITDLGKFKSIQKGTPLKEMDMETRYLRDVDASKLTFDKKTIAERDDIGYVYGEPKSTIEQTGGRIKKRTRRNKKKNKKNTKKRGHTKKLKTRRSKKSKKSRKSRK